MWGVVASVLGASVALAVVHTAFESFGSKRSDPQEIKQQALPKPTPGERHPGNKWTAQLYKTAKKASRK